MKTTVFNLTESRLENSDPVFDIYNEVYKIPTLPAYAVLSHNLDYNLTYLDEYNNHHSYELFDDYMVIKGVRKFFSTEGSTAVLTIHYSGIRDYSLFFPQIKNDKLKYRLGQFAEEASLSFESGAWLSFTALAASVLEGILFNIYGNKKFIELIKLAMSDSLLTSEEADLLDKVRITRNSLHSNKFESDFPDRKIGNDLYVLYDRLIKKNWDK